MQFMKRFGLASILPLAAGLFRSRATNAWTRVLAAAAIAALVAFTLFPDLQLVLPRKEDWDPEAFAREGRAIGLVANPNDFAYQSVGLAILHAALLPRRPRILDRVLLGAVLAGSAFCLVSSGSRSAVLGAAGAVSYILLSSGTKGAAKLALIATVLGVVSLGLSQSTVFEERLGSAYRKGLREENVNSRLDAQWIAMRTSLAYPLGVGFSEFEAATERAGTYLTLPTTDSVYFDTLLGAGFLGLCCLLGLFWTAWRHVGRSVVVGQRRVNLLRAGLLAFLLFGSATVVPVSIFLSPLFFSLVGMASHAHDDAS
jgi:O-antigen ligase